MRCTCLLLGVERTTFGGELHLRLCRNDLLKISVPDMGEQTGWVNTGVNN